MEAGGSFVLARVEVDANPQVVSLLGVVSIPMVEAFIRGRRVPGFLGAMPEAQVRLWMDMTVRGL
jgi:putative thioredoxin